MKEKYKLTDWSKEDHIEHPDTGEISRSVELSAFFTYLQFIKVNLSFDDKTQTLRDVTMALFSVVLIFWYSIIACAFSGTNALFSCIKCLFYLYVRRSTTFYRSYKIETNYTNMTAMQVKTKTILVKYHFNENSLTQ